MKPLGVIFTLFLVCHSSPAQTNLQVHAAFGYTEHFSLGIGCTFSDKHAVALLYGSDFFYHPKEFSTYMLQYSLALRRWTFSNITPVVGIKGGHAIFSDKYYTWEVASIIPFTGIQYHLTQSVELACQAGVAVSLEQKVRRLRYGEIGHYREILPEFKAGIVYSFNRRQ